MPTRNATAIWSGGGLKAGKGEFSGESGLIKGAYSFNTRVGDEKGTNPEELLAAAEAACFSMALGNALDQNGTPAQRVETKAGCTIAPVGPGLKITTIKLDVRATVPNIDAAKFKEIAETTKKTCPVSVALSGVDIQLNAQLG